MMLAITDLNPIHEALFTLPLPPSVNDAYADVIRHGSQGRLYVQRIATAELKTYKKDALFILAEQRIISPCWERAKSIGYEAIFYLPTRGSDLSNRIKALEDAIAETLGFNDNKIQYLSCTKRIDRQNPRVEVYLCIID